MQKIKILISLIGFCCIASVQAELTQLDDAGLSAVAGQSGVIVDIAVKGEGINIEQISYTDLLEGEGAYDYDTNGDGIDDAASGGTLLLQNITLKDIQSMRQTIEIKENGEVAIDVEPVTGMYVAMGDTPDSSSNNYSALALSNADGSRQSELLNNLALRLNLGASTIRVYTEPSTSMLAAAGVSQNHWAASSNLLISMNSGMEITQLDAQVLGFTQAAAERKVRFENGLSDGATLNLAQQKRANRLANEGALNIKGLKFYGKDRNGQFAAGNQVSLSQVIWADKSGFYMQSKALAGQLEIGEISAGNNRLGSLRVENINVSPMLNRIYSH